MSLELLGCRHGRTSTKVGFDMGGGLGTLLEAFGGAAKGGIQMAEEKAKDDKASSDEKAALNAAVSADASAAMANARAAVAVKQKAANATTLQATAAAATSAQARAAEKLKNLPDAAEKRVAAAEAAAERAGTDAGKNDKDVFKQALAEAWSKIVTQAHSGHIASADDDAPTKGSKGGKSNVGGDESGSFLTKKVIGPIPVWGVGLGAAGAAAAVYKFVIKK